MSVGDVVDLDQETAGDFWSMEDGQCEILTQFFESGEPNPKYITDQSCKRIGSLSLRLSGVGPDQKIKTILK